jgi:hypothetical protein
MGVPEPFNKILFAAVLWFVLYLPSKIIYSILHLVYGKPESAAIPEKKEDPVMNLLAQQV